MFQITSSNIKPTNKLWNTYSSFSSYFYFLLLCDWPPLLFSLLIRDLGSYHTHYFLHPNTWHSLYILRYTQRVFQPNSFLFLWVFYLWIAKPFVKVFSLGRFWLLVFAAQPPFLLWWLVVHPPEYTSDKIQYPFLYDTQMVQYRFVLQELRREWIRWLVIEGFSWFKRMRLLNLINKTSPSISVSQIYQITNQYQLWCVFIWVWGGNV